MQKSKKRNPLSLAILASLAATSLAFAPVYAQDNSEDQTDETEQAEEGEDLETLVVTGSKLQRREYTSIAPLQVISAEGAREVGLVDAGAILQSAPAAAGQQIDLTFQGFVLDNGPGASTVSLRGLGSARSLVLMNGRRLAPAGVEGAPSAPDLNLVPSGLVQQYDLLLDGASSIYGSDAVAGVVNIILRDDFNGFEVRSSSFFPTQDAGRTDNLSLVWGKNYDRGFIGMGLDYNKQEATALSDLDWTRGCEQHAEIDENGNVRTQDLFYSTTLGMEWDECALGSLAARVSVPGAGSIYYTPGFSNGGWGNFSESSAFGFGVDGDGDGRTDLTFRDYDLNGTPESQAQHLYPEQERINFMSYGEWTFEGDMNNTVYFELGYNERDTFARSGQPQLFPDVPADNPYNLCNPNGVDGVDCGLAYDALLTNPNFISSFANNFAQLCADNGIPAAACTPATFGLLNGPIGPQGTLPIVAVRGDRSSVSTNIKQYRGVIGLEGDLPMLENDLMSSWRFDTAVSFTQSEGVSSRIGIRGDRLEYSLATSRIDANGNVVCGTGSDGCVPINMFAPSLYPVGTVVGDFATQAERDYLFDSRDFDTTYKQTLFTAFAGGFIGQLQGGPISAGFGVEYRIDDINSKPDDIARDGLFFGFFADGGAAGDKFTREFFGEVELPLLAGKPFAEELVVNLSARLTDDQFYGSDTTYSAKIGYRPINSLLLRSTFGTSYRAPNLRELFLRDQTGFGNVFDPCIVPEAALDPVNGGYNADLDPREAQVLANCVANGVDPTTLDNGGFTTLSTEISSGGLIGIDEETSESFTYGFSFEQPWTNAFNMTIGATYYDIEIEDAIIEPSAAFLVNDCYFDEQGDSSFCNRIVRGSDGFIEIVNAGFLNRDSEKIRGIDVNLNMDKDFRIGERNVNVALNVIANRSLEASTIFTNDDGGIDFDDDQGEFGFPDWQGEARLSAGMGDWRAVWETRYIGSVEQDVDGIDEFSDINGIGDTCLGAPNDVLCRDIGFADSYMRHSFSVNWSKDNWGVGVGVRNIFEEEPPFVDGTEILSTNNVPLGYGYDLLGRTFFLNLTWRQ